MSEKYTYSGDRTKNHFTAYLLEFYQRAQEQLPGQKDPDGEGLLLDGGNCGD